MQQPLSQRAMTVYFSPNPGTYAVIRLDPVAMVKDLNDPEALSAAEALQTKTYVVYLRHELELPFPNRLWYRYNIWPVAPSLRAEDKDEGYAADMCVPIFPNTSHPRGRAPLRTVPAFPYTNCYHWAEFSIDIRVRARPEQFDERRAILLPGGELVQMNCHWGDDIMRMNELQRQYRAATRWQAPAAPPEMPFLDRRQSSASASTTSVDTGSSCAYYSSPSEGSEDSVDALIDIFAGPNQDVGVLPLVDLWLDLAENLKQEDIPNPLEFLKERDAVVSIIQAARERAYAVLNAPSTGTASQTELPQQHEGVQDAPTEDAIRSRSLPGLPKLLRKWSEGLKALKNRVRKFRDVRVPSVSV